ncbi:MAG: propionyl-coenzyme A carboxylase alpha polypeptide, partial [Mesorhizobium sp.]
MEPPSSFAPPSGLPAISPSRGEIRYSPAFANLQRCRKAPATKLPISPLEGEMSGRTEGG